MIKKLVLILLALCVVFFMIGCDDGGSGGGGENERGTGAFIVSDMVPSGIVEITPVPGKGIKFTQGGIEFEIHVSLTLDDNGTFTSVEKLWMDGVKQIDSEFTGTWDQSGSTINTHAKSDKDNMAGTTNPIDPPDDESFTVSDGGNTLTEDVQDPLLPARLVLKK